MTKTRRNDLCPCGSGLKYKKCCLKSAPTPPTKEERTLALGVLHKLSHGLLAGERTAALSEFWNGVPSTTEVPEPLRKTAELTFDGWFYYDRKGAAGLTPTEMLLERAPLDDGPRAYLERLANSVMDLWQVSDVAAGATVSLISSTNRQELVVWEPNASRSLEPGMTLAARINPLGVSGQAEIDLGCVQFGDAAVDDLQDALDAHSRTFEDAHPGAPPREWLKTLPPLFNEVWLRSQG